MITYPLIYRAPNLPDHPRKGQRCKLVMASQPTPVKCGRFWLRTRNGGCSRLITSRCAPWNCVIEFQDGYRVVTINPRKSLRKLTAKDLQMGLFI